MNLEEIIKQLPPEDQAEILKAAGELIDSKKMEKGAKQLFRLCTFYVARIY